MNDEEELIERARTGEREAFRQLVLRHQENVFHLALGLLHNRDDAEDAVQDVFIRTYEALGRFRGDSRLGTWLYRVTLNVCRDHQRKYRFASFQESLGLGGDGDPGSASVSSRFQEERPDADPERTAASAELRSWLARAVRRLPPAERDVFVLRQLRQLSIRETAEVTGRAEGTVKNLLFRALKKLQKELAVHRQLEEAI